MSSPKTIKIDDQEYVRLQDVPTVAKIGNEVIVRTYSAGVHIGELDGKWDDVNKPITLKNARRIWRWRGANTLNEVATVGLNRNEYSRISKPVSSIQLSAIEVIPVASGIDLSEVWNG